VGGSPKITECSTLRRFPDPRPRIGPPTLSRPRKGAGTLMSDTLLKLEQQPRNGRSRSGAGGPFA